MSAATKHTKTGVAVLVAIGSFAISLIAQSAPDRTRPPMIGPPPPGSRLSGGFGPRLTSTRELPVPVMVFRIIVTMLMTSDPQNADLKPAT